MPNRLQNASSPYLLQHAAHPVDWYPWGEEAFARARQENKPVLVSIGYAACHWCHVMAHESFEQESVAAYMNQNFINIKVDREEHPDVDHMYMDALQLMTGSGGWPLNIFVTPDKKPFYGGTYFPPRPFYGRSSWPQILEAIHRMWQEKPEEIALQSDQLVRHLQQAAQLPFESNMAGSPSLAETIRIITKGLLKDADRENGGFGHAPKFPATMAIQYLLRYAAFSKNGNAVDPDEMAEEAMAHGLRSLDAMIDGGIYDQVGGGFSRYATDDRWRIPHFEKMLYDNALLLLTLADAFQLSGNSRYKTVLEETVSFCLNELRAPGLAGGFWCALDADSEGIEGRFYTWNEEQLKEVIPEIPPAVRHYFGMTREGNWEGQNILYRAATPKEIMDTFSLTETEWERMRSDTRNRLFRIRKERTPPAADDKIVLSWNALMNIALIRVGVVLDRPEYIEEAKAHLDWMLQHFNDRDGGMYHVFKDGQAYIPAKLDDYAFLIKAMLTCASVAGASEYIVKALPLLEHVQEFFAGEQQLWYYFSSRRQQDIVVRKMEQYDGALPSANAIMAENLNRLGNLMERPDWLEQSEAMIGHMQSVAGRYPLSFSYWAGLILNRHARPRQLIIAGDPASGKKMLNDWHRHYFAPQVYAVLCRQQQPRVPAFEHKSESGSPLLYLCARFQCATPVRSLAEINTEIKKMP